MGRDKLTRVEALEWLRQGNEIYFSDDPLVAGSDLLVDGLYKEGAEKVEVVLYPGATETSTLVLTLSNDYQLMLEAIFEVGILTPCGPIIREEKNVVWVTWGRDRARFPDHIKIGIKVKGSLYRIDSILDLKRTDRKITRKIDFGGTLDSSVIELLKEAGALIDPIVHDPENEFRATGMDIVLPESYDKALECMIIIALLGLDVSSTMIAEPGQCARIDACAVDALLA